MHLPGAFVAAAVALAIGGCAPVIIDPGAEGRTGSGASSGADPSPTGPGAGGDAGATGQGGSTSASTSASTGSAMGGGPLGPSSASCDAAGQSGSLFGAACSYAPCQGALAAPKMVSVPAGGGSYCIDDTTVTQADYAAFLAAHVDPSDQPSRCLWNKDFEPGDDPLPGDCPAGSFAPSQHGGDPVTCVDLCDAEAYCLWAGKRLCGKIGGGDVPWAMDGNPAIDQLVHACEDADLAEQPGSKVYEWEPVCDADLGPTSLCNLRDLTCYIFQNWRASSQSTKVGFRCCAD